MHRGGLSLVLLAIIAVHLVGAMAFASLCSDPCTDGGERTECPPICALCASCTHTQQAIVQPAAATAPLTTAHHVIAHDHCATSSHLSADIFHVPLFG